jgi:hypothetical protein
MFACANILHFNFASISFIHFMLAWDLVKLYDECFRTYVNASYDDMGIIVILCKHGV